MTTEFINLNSFLNRLNPTIKIIIFFLLIVATFFPFGFTWQLITLGIIHVFWFLGKLKFKNYLKIITIFIIMFLVIAIINWISYKDPGVSFILNGNRLVSPNWWWQTNPLASPGTYINQANGNIFIAGQIFGGKDVGGIIGIEKMMGMELFGLTEIGEGFYSLPTSSNIQDLTNELNNIGFTVINGPVDAVRYIYVFKSESYSISTFGLTLALFITIKIFSTILIVTILTSTTSPLELTYGFNELLFPLSYIGIPINELAMILTLSIRFIPSLLEESHRVLKAQASRGIDIKRGKFRDKAKALVSLLIPMFAISFRKSEELSNAMEARSYNPRIQRSRYRNFKIKIVDWFLLIPITIFFGMTTFFSLAHTFGNITFLLAPMGIIDSIIILL